MKSHLLVFDDRQVERPIVTDVIDNIGEISNWLAFFSGAVMLVSSAEASELAAILREKLPNIRFIVVEIHKGKKGGLLAKSVWKFMNDPKPVSEK